MSDTCPKCGKTVEAGALRCPACGTEIPAAIVQPSKALVVFGALIPVIGLIVIAGGLFIVVLILLRHTNRPTNQSAVTAPAPVVAPAVSPPPAAPPTPTAPTPPFTSPPIPEPLPPAIPPVAVHPPVAPTPPAVPVINVPAPVLSDFDPAIVPSGSTLTIHGEGLKAVNRVLLINSRGANSVEATIVATDDKQLRFNVPEIPFADNGILIAAFSPGGVAILADQHTLSAESYGPDSHPHDSVVSVHNGGEIFAGDRMVILGKPGSEVSLGNDCVAFLDEDSKLTAMGKNCKVYCAGTPSVAPGISRQGLTRIKAVSFNFENDLFRVKPAPPGQDQ